MIDACAQAKNNAAHIALANPSTILSLLHDLDVANRALENLRADLAASHEFQSGLIKDNLAYAAALSERP